MSSLLLILLSTVVVNLTVLACVPAWRPLAAVTSVFEGARGLSIAGFIVILPVVVLSWLLAAGPLTAWDLQYLRTPAVVAVVLLIVPLADLVLRRPPARLLPRQPGFTLLMAANATVQGAALFAATRLDSAPGAVVPQLEVEDWSGDEGNDATASARFTLTLSEPTTATVTVEYETVADSAAEFEDFTRVSGTVTFLPGQTAQTVTVPIVVLNTNRAPRITPLVNQAVDRGQVFDVPVEATDPEGKPLVLSATGVGGFGLPAFVTFQDHGDGTGLFRVQAGIGDRGNYTVVVRAVDSGERGSVGPRPPAHENGRATGRSPRRHLRPAPGHPRRGVHQDPAPRGFLVSGPRVDPGSRHGRAPERRGRTHTVIALLIATPSLDRGT